MKIRAVDFETSDNDKEKAAGKPVGIVEFGFTDLTFDGVIGAPVAALVNPGVPISPAARGIHHITDEMLVGAMSPTEACGILMDGMEPGDMFAAHNAAFERMFFGGGAFPWICTMICAKHLWEDAPDYKNQTLRYWLGVDNEFLSPELAMPPHRAGPDTYVTAYILRRMLDEKSPGALLDLTTAPILQKRVMFGEKHRGQLWSDMDRGFLEWVIDKDFSAEIKHTAKHWLNQIQSHSNPFV